MHQSRLWVSGLVGAGLLLSACKLSSVDRGGSAPEIYSVDRTDDGYPSEAVVCTDMTSTLTLSGKFAPMPTKTLTDDEGVALPRVYVVALGSGDEYELAGATYNHDHARLTVTVEAAQLPPGPYDVRVVNPNGRMASAGAALQVVPPPTISEIVPNFGVNSDVTPVLVSGESFRATGDGVPPAITMAPVEGGAVADLENESLRSSTEVDASVPPALEPGFYDLTLTNPEGCSATLPGAFEVRAPALIDLCSSVVPSFGWVDARTPIEICASNAAGHGLLPIPEAFIIIAGEQIPLRRPAFVSAGTASTTSVMSAVVPSRQDDARIVVGGPYSIRVVNPDGSEGTVQAAFTVIPDPPPHILTVAPARGDKSTFAQTLTVIGESFKDTVLDDSSPVLTITLLAADGAEFPCGDATVTLDSPQPGQQTAVCSMNLPDTTGAFVVRVRHEDDGSFDLYASFAVTNPSRKLSSTPVIEASLREKRRAHGGAVGMDDLGNRFVYVAGGESGDAAALASVEFAPVSKFGPIGTWTTNREPLPEARTGLALIAVDRYLYAIGGSADGVAPLTTSTVRRSVILGSDSAPTITSISAGSGGSLASGTYYYRVAAVQAAATENPLGETLPSDFESIRVQASGSATLNFHVADSAGVDHFVIYRSPEPNMLTGSEVLLADDVPASATSFTDDGSGSPNTTVTPLAAGSTGKWVAMAELAVPRFDAAATALRLDSTHAFLYVTGGRSASGTSASVEYAALAADESSIEGTWLAGPDLPVPGSAVAEPRAEHALIGVGSDQVAQIAADSFHLVAVGGTKGNRTQAGQALASILVGSVDATGAITAWSGGGQTAARVGLTAYVVNDYLYAFNGWGGSGGSFASASESGQACGGLACPGPLTFSGFSSATMSFPTGLKYRAALAYYAAYFYFLGGSDGLSIANTSQTVARGGY